MAKFLSGRQSNFNIGIKSYTENQTVLQTIGKVGIGTTNAGNYSLYVVGAANITTSVTSPIYYGTSANLTGIVTFGSLWVNGTSRLIGNLQIDGDTNITGNLTIGGTSAYIAASTLTVGDKDIVLGFTTNPTDTTSNHGGIAIASTEGSPLISLYSAGINTLPDTYKQFMWIKGGTFGAGTTDAWLSNYAIGIGSTQVPNGVRLAVGGVQITDNTVNATNANLSYISGINLNYSGIGTVVNLYSTNSTLSSLTGTAATYTTGNFATVTGSNLYYNSGIVTTLSGTTATYTTGNITTLNSTNGYINTGIVTTLTGTNLNYSGIGTVVNFYSTNSTLSSLTGTAVTYTTGNFATVTGSDLYYNSGIVTTLSGTTATYTTGNFTTVTGSNLYYNSGIVTSLAGTNLNYSGIGTITTLNSTNSSIASLTGTAATYTTGNFATVTGSNLYYNSGIVTTLSGTTATYTTGNITTLNSTNGYINTGIVTTLSGTTATYTTGNITTLNSTNGYINAGIVTTLSGTNLNYSGISTLGTIQISSGIVTATSGVVTYYGDGSHLFGVNAFNVINQDITSSPVYPTFVSNVGVSSVGISTTKLVFVPASGSLGIGTTNPTSTLDVIGDGRFTGVVTATTFSGNINAGVGTITTLSGTSATYTTGYFTNGYINTGIVTTLSGTNLNYSGISTISGVQISSGIITATSFSGDGSQLTNLSGMGVAAGPTGFGADVFYTNTVGYVSATTTIASVDASLAPILYTRYQEVVINDGFDLIIGTGNDLLLNVFQLS